MRVTSARRERPSSRSGVAREAARPDSRASGTSASRSSPAAPQAPDRGRAARGSRQRQAPGPSGEPAQRRQRAVEGQPATAHGQGDEPRGHDHGAAQADRRGQRGRHLHEPGQQRERQPEQQGQQDVVARDGGRGRSEHPHVEVEQHQADQPARGGGPAERGPERGQDEVAPGQRPGEQQAGVLRRQDDRAAADRGREPAGDHRQRGSEQQQRLGLGGGGAGRSGARSAAPRTARRAGRRR